MLVTFMATAARSLPNGSTPPHRLLRATASPSTIQPCRRGPLLRVNLSPCRRQRGPDPGCRSDHRLCRCGVRSDVEISGGASRRGDPVPSGQQPGSTFRWALLRLRLDPRGAGLAHRVVACGLFRRVTGIAGGDPRAQWWYAVLIDVAGQVENDEAGWSKIRGASVAERAKPHSSPKLPCPPTPARYLLCVSRLRAVDSDPLADDGTHRLGRDLVICKSRSAI